jgi:hypothetical protein
MSPALSVVVVAYGMQRELPRTIRSLSPPLQRDVESGSYEVIVVDNGSPQLVQVDPQPDAATIRCTRIDDAPASPAHAANIGLELATGDLVGLIIDGARLASPRLLAMALLASRLSDRPVITAPAYHLGEVPHMQAAEAGYDQEAEDRLLAGSGWEDDGYRLFEVSTLGGSSGRGWFGPMGESSSLFMPRALWRELGGLDERFDLPGGGYVNHDLYHRACSLPDAQLISLLGEGTFHQHHGGAATSRRLTKAEMHAQYEALRDRPYEPPSAAPIQLGTIPTQAVGHLLRSAEWAARSASRA